jgi:uracil-DNA glycosylase family protein
VTNHSDTSKERPGAQQWVPPGAGIEQLRAAAEDCRGCELWEPASRVVFSAGDPHAPVAMVGEQPGDVEDQRGIPFVGPAGRLLQRAADEAGLIREQVYVTNAVKHFRFTARGKRRIHATPDVAHVLACRPWLIAELAAVDPQIVVLLGATAARSLLGAGFRVTQHRGEVITGDTPNGPRRFVPTVHPSAVLRVPAPDRPAAYAELVADLRVVVKELALGA